MKSALIMHGVLKYFSDIDDPRSLRNQKHSLVTLIGTTLLASLSGIDSFSGFADFTEAHYEHLIDYFDFPYGSTSHDTYQRLWDAISPSQFYKSFLLFTESLSKLPQTFINLDGKAIRHSGTERHYI